MTCLPSGEDEGYDSLPGPRVSDQARSRSRSAIQRCEPGVESDVRPRTICRLSGIQAKLVTRGTASDHECRRRYGWPPDNGTIQNCQPRASGCRLMVRGTALRPILLPSGENDSAPSTKRRSLKAAYLVSPPLAVDNRSLEGPTMSCG